MKRCDCCKIDKPKSEFYKRSDSKDGLRPICKLCVSNKVKKSYNAEVQRGYTFKSKYGLTLNDYEQMFAQQNGRCALCGTDEPGGQWGRLCVDHDHETGRIRALLCNCCNIAIGHLNDDPKLLEKAAAYLRAFQEEE